MWILWILTKMFHNVSFFHRNISFSNVEVSSHLVGIWSASSWILATAKLGTLRGGQNRRGGRQSHRWHAAFGSFSGRERHGVFWSVGHSHELWKTGLVWRTGSIHFVIECHWTCHLTISYPHLNWPSSMAKLCPEICSMPSLMKSPEIAPPGVCVRSAVHWNRAGAHPQGTNGTLTCNDWPAMTRSQWPFAQSCIDPWNTLW